MVHQLILSPNVTSSAYWNHGIDASNYKTVPDSKVHGANMGPIWGRQDRGGSHVGPINFALSGYYN